MKQFNGEKSFTLLELLIVIGILAILSTTTVLVLNPSELLKNTRDSKRLSELNSLNSALNIYLSQGGANFGSSSIVYVSIPDTSPTCANSNLPVLPFGWDYACSTPDNYRKTNGFGWVPVDLTSLSIGSLLSVLPVDPINIAENNLYYSYVAGGSWELTAWLESTKYLSRVSRDGGDSIAYELGTDLFLTPNRKTNFSFNDFPVVVNKAGQPGWYKNIGSGTVLLGADSEGDYLNANQFVWYEWQENIPFDSNALYKISCKIRQIQNPSSVYCGIAGIASDKTTYLNESGDNTYTSQHYFAADGIALVAGAGYDIFTGYFKGHGTPAGGRKPSSGDPGKMYPGAVYIRPIFLLNYDGNGIADVDFEILEIVE